MQGLVHKAIKQSLILHLLSLLQRQSKETYLKTYYFQNVRSINKEEAMQASSFKAQ